MRQRWQSYDAVAGEYKRSWHDAFEPVAHDLVRLLAPAPDEAVLDVGTGTGVVVAAVSANTERGKLVGIDPSVPMLQLARARAPLAAVAARSPGLPFPSRAFDVVVANLVVSHFPSYEEGLADMVRVLRPGGRLGVTAWGSMGDEPVDDRQQRELAEIWNESAARFVDLDFADDTVGAAIPGEAWFADPARLRAALVGSRLRHVDVYARTYRTTLPLAEALAGSETSFRGRYLRHALGDAEWTRFRREVAAAAGGALPDRITRVDELLIALGRKADEARP